MTKKDTKNTELIINKIVIAQTKRTSQDVEKWRNALQVAESITFPRRILLYDLYEDILLDAHLSSVINKRISALSNMPVTFVDDSGKENSEITKLLQTEAINSFISNILWSRFFGHSLFEFSFNDKQQTTNNKLILPTLIPRKHVIPEFGWVIKNQTDTAPLLNFRENPFTNFMFEAGKSDDKGLLLKAAPLVIYKRGGFADWAQFSEIFGMPFRKGVYDGYDDQTRIQLENALKQAGSAAYAVIPKGSDIEFVDTGNQSGANTLYKGLIDTCNAEISKLILGNTLTTEQGDKGARALGEVHKQGESAINEDDKQFILFKLNYEFRNILIINGFAVQNGTFKFKEDEEMPLNIRIELDTKINEIAPIDKKYFYETYNVPESTEKPIEPSVVERSRNERSRNSKNPKSQILNPKSFMDFFSAALLK